MKEPWKEGKRNKFTIHRVDELVGKNEAEFGTQTFQCGYDGALSEFGTACRQALFDVSLGKAKSSVITLFWRKTILETISIKNELYPQ